MDMRPGDNRPIEQQWHDCALDWADKDAAAQLLEETKSSVLAEMVMNLLRDDPKLSVAKAEMTVKAGKVWRETVGNIVDARKAANRARVARDYMRMRFSVWVADDANHRAGSRR